MLAIAGGKFSPGDRLPSTRMVADRFHINANTVSAAYKQLENLGWVHSVRGSGVYVRSTNRGTTGNDDVLDKLVLSLIEAARGAGISATSLQTRVERWLTSRPVQFVFVHPEQELQVIVARELRNFMAWPVTGCDPAHLAQYISSSVFLTLPSKEAEVRQLLPTAVELVVLQIQRVDRILNQYLPIRRETLLVIASAWPSFLYTARKMLAAAGCDCESVIFADTRDAGWDRTLVPGATVVCDLVTADVIPNGVHKIPFSLISEAAINRLTSIERFFKA